MIRKIDEMKGEFDLSSFTGLHRLYAYLVGELHLINVNYKTSSIKITVKCRTLEILKGLWDHYCSGRLNAVTEKCLITEKVKDELGMETLKLAATMLEEDYLACKLSLMEISGAFYCFNCYKQPRMLVLSIGHFLVLNFFGHFRVMIPSLVKSLLIWTMFRIKRSN